MDPLGLCVVNPSGNGFSNGIISPNAIPNLMVASTGYNMVDAYRLLHEGYRTPSVDIPWGQYGKNILSGLGWLADTTLRPISDIVAGFGDTITFGGTRWIRSQWNQAFGWYDSVDYDSAGYNVGRWAGYTWAIATGAVAVEAAAAGIVSVGAAVGTAATTMIITKPEWVKDFTDGFFFESPPPATPAGNLGYWTRRVVSIAAEKLKDNL